MVDSKVDLYEMEKANLFWEAEAQIGIYILSGPRTSKSRLCGSPM